MEEGLISVIIPVYNVEKYLQECLNSVIAQTYKNIEIIVIDDGSTDNSGKICDEYAKKDNRIKVIHKANGGLSDARNFGIDISKGKYVYFVDSDDYIDIDTIESMYKIAKDYSADIVTFSHYILNEQNLFCNYTSKIKELTNIEGIKEVVIDSKIRSYAWEKLWKKELFDEIRFPKGRKFEDIITTPLLFEKANKIVLYDVPKYYYRQRKDSILGKQTNELRIEYINSMCDVNEYLMKRYPELDKYLNYCVVNMTLNTYNDIATFGMYELLQEKIVQEIYCKSKKIMQDEENREFIKQKAGEVKYTHIEMLFSNKDKYIEEHLSLPVIYPEYIGKEQKIRDSYKEKRES